MVCELTQSLYNKTPAQCTNQEIYHALIKLINNAADKRKNVNSKKRLYYICAEFLIGKLLSNNLINLGIYDDVKKELEENGKNICEIEDIENEPSLGNGGLGRLAACFLDSAATLGLNGVGIGINYHFGLFRQVFKNNSQTAVPDAWLDFNSPLIKTDVTYKIHFQNLCITSRMYDINITGYNSVVNRLHLFDTESADENIVCDGISFDKTDIKKNLTLFLYPDDSDENGKLLRIYQQYFMVSNAAQLILDECIAKGCKLYDLYNYAVIQINDTHPTMIIPELIRLLCKHGIDMDTAADTVRRTCAYTNHTILAEALEKWPLEYIKKTVPHLIPIIEFLDKKVRERFDNPKLYIIDDQKQVHMANIDIHYCFSVNGVASLHTEILKNEELKHFYDIYPDKFNNKTNGITFRRWLIHANPQLSDMITSLIGDRFKTDCEELEKLLDFKNDETVLNSLIQIKHHNKIRLKDYILKHQNIIVDENSIFDIQINACMNINASSLMHFMLFINTLKFGREKSLLCL